MTDRRYVSACQEENQCLRGFNLLLFFLFQKRIVQSIHLGSGLK